ncbi:MAG: ATP synthase F1 subunit delta [Phycisphaerae bacterium]|nr:ATP synthase F1 subunit delta [Phycisphaerae bacterium]
MIAYAQNQTVMDPDLLRLADEYAAALLDALTDDDPMQIRDELMALAKLIGGIDGARELFVSATTNANQRVELVERIFGTGRDDPKVSPVIASLLGVLARNNRLMLIAAVSDSYDALLKQRMNIVDVTVRTAVAMDPEQIENLKNTLATRLDITPLIHNVVDSCVLAGMVVQLGDMVYDLSAAGEIARMIQNISKEN